MMVKPVNETANDEIKLRIERTLSNLTQLRVVAEYLKDQHLARKIKEARYAVYNITSYVKRKYRVQVASDLISEWLLI